MTGADDSEPDAPAHELRENAKALLLAYCQIANRPLPSKAHGAAIIDELLAGTQSGDTDQNKVISDVIEALARLPTA